MDFNAASWSASDLLTDVYRMAKLPDSGTIDYTPAVVLGMATQAIHDWGGRLLSTARDGRMVTSIIRSLSTDQVGSDGHDFALPPMAVADTIESVAWIDPNNNECRLQLIPIGMESVFSRATDTGTPTCYALADGIVRVYPKPDGRGSLRISYMRRHGQLVVGSDTTSVVSIASASAGTATAVTVTAVPASFVATAWVDAFGSSYPYRTKIGGARITSVVGLVVTVAVPYAASVSAGIVGETLCIYGKTPYVQLPLEMRQSLTQQIAVQLTSELGDLQLASGYDRLADKGAERARDMLSPRAKSDKQKLINPYSLARSGRRSRFWAGRES